MTNPAPVPPPSPDAPSSMKSIGSTGTADSGRSSVSDSSPRIPTRKVSTGASTKSNGASLSIAKTLAKLQSIPTNRSCADCRLPLVDSSQTYVSHSPLPGSTAPDSKHAVPSFQFTHEAFAPTPGLRRATHEHAIDPAELVTEQLGGHGVFVCSNCAEAHRSMEPRVTVVRSVKKSSAWKVEEVQFLASAGGNAWSWTVLEGFMPESWAKRRPTHTSTLAQRQVFARAKYDALAFVTPQGGPLAPRAWRNIIAGKPLLGRWRTEDLMSFQRTALSDGRTKSLRRLSSTEDAPPQRLVDFFCVLGPTGRLERTEAERDLSDIQSPEELILETGVIDLYPAAEEYDDMDFPEHVSKFVFPEGCRPSEHRKSPSLFTFVLTLSNGQRLYGAALRVYDATMDTEGFRAVLEESGYRMALPWWLAEATASEETRKGPSDVMYLPKCLVVLSHYPFFDLWRRFLRQLYRITLVEAPLPIERYVSNFVSEVPLPPQGKIEVRFGFTDDEMWCVRRPPVNKLPLANFSFRPLFAALSVGNIMAVMGSLLTETRVVLLSRHYSLLTPVAEALLCLLFPFEWQGMYIPIMPYSMLDILDAPVPYLVGVHSRYLEKIKPNQRPRDVVFVDLDKDTIHMGFHDDGSEPLPPSLPEREAAKLKTQLEEYGGLVYLVPDNGVKGRIMVGNGKLLVNTRRPVYAYMSHEDASNKISTRDKALGRTEKAFLSNKPITGFFSEQGQLAERDVRRSIASPGRTNRLKPLFQLGRKSSKADSVGTSNHADSDLNLLDIYESDGFSALDIRNSFLRFFVTVFNRYERYLSNGSSSDLFHEQEFLASYSGSPASRAFLSSVMGTQLFQAFLEERKRNPNGHEVLFFDESIVAKDNRSRRKTLATGGKKETPFLDDTSGKITETFTPPPPSNWGLPDDGQGYSYGSFPKFDPSLFGKVRPAKQWPQEATVHRRSKASVSVFKKQQELLSKAIKPSSATVPTLLTHGEKQRSTKDFEWAICSVSVPAKNSSLALPVTEDDDSPAFHRMLTARRKQSILLEIIVRLQAVWRGHVARRQVHELKEVILHKQRASRQTLAPGDDEPYKIDMCAVAIQRNARAYLEHRHYQAQRDAAVTLQRWTRGSQARKLALKLRVVILLQRLARGARDRRRAARLRAALRLQSWIRGERVRWLVLRLRHAAVHAQAIIRGRRARFAFGLVMEDIRLLQAHFRGMITRKLVSKLLRGRGSRYREQIFHLWQRAHTPLSYRSKYWQIIDGPRFLCVSLAEMELWRLWKELGVAFPPLSTDRLKSLLDGDGLFFQAEKAGLANQCYVKSIVVRNMMKSGTSAEFPGEKDPKIKKAAERERTERVQVYERLHQNEDNGGVLDMYKAFGIASDEKAKKARLAGGIWIGEELNASRSSAVMKLLFPELEYSTNINTVPATRKAIKKMRAGSAVLTPLDASMLVEAKLDKIMRGDMKDFATALVAKGSRVTTEKTEAERERLAQFERRKMAIMEAHGSSDWPACRYDVIIVYLYPGLYH